LIDNILNAGTMKAALLFIAIFVMTTARAWAADPAPAAEEQLKKLEQDWAEAYVKRDNAFMQRVTSDDFAFIGPDGNMVGKTEYVKSIEGDTVFTAFKIDELKVRVYGDAAVVLGLATITAKTKGEDESGRYSFTDVFVKMKGEWKAVSGHVTPVAKDPATE
jgi:ketosteroid isomerase-like protein